MRDASEQALNQVELEQVAELEHALERLEKDAYGICEQCGRPISGERLEATPEATRCIACQANSSGRRS